MVTLEEIVLNKKKELEELKRALPEKQLIAGLKKNRQIPRGFKKSLRAGKGIRIIAEIKKASPSEGTIREDFNVMKIAQCYENAGACAISVLTENKFFLGRTSYLAMVRSETELPVLRKDFLIDRYQIVESAVLGCDSVLLIASILSDKQLAEFVGGLESYEIDPLVEVHDETELERALRAGAKIVGINNRDLKTMRIDIKTSEVLAKRIPKSVIKVAESGFESHDEVKRLAEMGIDAFLVGTSILKSKNMESKIKQLMGVGV